MVVTLIKPSSKCIQCVFSKEALCDYPYGFNASKIDIKTITEGLRHGEQERGEQETRLCHYSPRKRGLFTLWDRVSYMV